MRRSGRANKGHHTKNQDALDEPPAKPKAKAKNEKKAQAARSNSAQTEEEEDDAIIRCVCGDQRDIRGRQMIACDICEAWQHVKCLGLQEGDEWANRTYYCEQCKPEDHVELVAAIARGEKPWNRKKGSRKSNVKARQSDVRPDPEPDNKAKTGSSSTATPQPTSKEQPKPKEEPQDKSQASFPEHADEQPAGSAKESSKTSQAHHKEVPTSPKEPSKEPLKEQQKDATNGHVEQKVCNHLTTFHVPG